MGTRADFYIGRGKDAEWIGSFAWDGYPDGLADSIVQAVSESEFREAVAKELAGRDDATIPAQGWPWPWDDSNTTDYAYAIEGETIYGSCFGGNWFNVREELAAIEKDDNYEREESGDIAEFPNMASRKATTFGMRSGTIIIGG